MNRLWSFAMTVSLIIALLPGQSLARPPPMFQSVGEYFGVPASVLYAVAMQESQRRWPDGRIAPWPWTLNIAGQGHFYENRQAVEKALAILYQSGSCNVDVGLMQINLCYHGHRTDRWASLIIPQENLSVAARILIEQAAHCDGDWWCAVGRYHAPNHAVRAARYRRKVRRWQSD